MAWLKKTSKSAESAVIAPAFDALELARAAVLADAEDPTLGVGNWPSTSPLD